MNNYDVVNIDLFLKDRGLKKASAEETNAMKDKLVKSQSAKIWCGMLKEGNDGQLYVLIYCVKKLKSWKRPKARLAMVTSTAFKGTLWNYNTAFTAIAGYSYDFSDESRTHAKKFQYLEEWEKHPFFFSLSDNRDELAIERVQPKSRYIPSLMHNLLANFPNCIAKGLRLVMDYPHEIEMLVKANLQHFITNKNVLRKKYSEISGIVKYSKESGLKYSDVPTIQWNINRGIKPCNAKSREEIALIGSVRKKLGLDEKGAEEVIDYLKKQNKLRGYSDYNLRIMVEEYHSYLDYRKQLGMDNTDHSARFPSDFEEAYMRVRDQLREIEEKGRLEELARQIKNANLTKVFFSHGDYSVIHPETIEQFIALGNVMSNCVGRCGYYDKQCEGKCFILAIKKDDEFYACLELVPTGEEGKDARIKQLYRKHNSECDEKTREFVNREIIPMFNEGKLAFMKKSVESANIHA